MKISKEQYNKLPLELQQHFFTGNINPCVKSLRLMSYLITLVSRPGDIVLDPFSGSFTTCIAADRMGRRWIGIEKDLEYVKIGKARLKAETAQTKMKI